LGREEEEEEKYGEGVANSFRKDSHESIKIIQESEDLPSSRESLLGNERVQLRSNIFVVNENMRRIIKHKRHSQTESQIQRDGFDFELR